MSFMTEFKEFAVKGNVVDLAVGVIIGGAFGDDGAGQAVFQVGLVAQHARRFDDVGREDARRHRVHQGRYGSP